MENKSIVILKHHPMNVSFANPFYLNQCDDLNERVIIDCTSRCKEYSADLSPFYLGPVKGPDGATAATVETFFQCGKVYPCHDDGGQPNAAFFEWRKEMYGKAVRELSKNDLRHPEARLGYKSSDCLYFPFYDTRTKKYIPLDYVTARKKVYIPAYAAAVSATKTFKMMKELLSDGRKLALVDFDGYNYYSEAAMERLYESYLKKCKNNRTSPTKSREDYTSIKSLKDVMNCPFMPAGHAFTIKALLQGDFDITFGKLLDISGILS